MIDRKLSYGRDQIRRFLKDAKNIDIVLDLGAGQGNDLLIAKAINSSAQLHAVEVYQPYIQALRLKEIAVYPLNMESDCLPFEDSSVDVVIMNQVLEHVKEVFWIFHEVTRVLKIDGSFIIGVPNLAAFHNRVLLLLGKQPTPLKNYSAHVRGWSKDDLIKFFNHCFADGYQLKGFGGSNFYPFPPFVAKPLARLLPNMAWSIFTHWQKQAQYSAQFLEYPIRKSLETNFYVGK